MGPAAGAEEGRVTVVGLTPGERLLLWAGLPALGIVLGFLLPPVADGATGLPWAPLEGPLELIASWEGPWVAAALAGTGLLLGAGLAFLAVLTCLRITLTDDRIRLDKDGRTRTLRREDVAAVFLDGKRLVVLAPDTRELLREEPEGGAEALAAAFAAHGYPWRDGGDPYAEHFRRWVPGAPEAPAGVNALLKARESALRKKSRQDAEELREEVQKLGAVVRDGSGHRQYWRPLIPS
ncbi:hypothetical protein RM780_01750 [Streptomyces sp. DSM 44917]|uniref:Uncharacterized protein n=1 Tax=Streptomyces boetiae TaxID=3075541 RepID=A0ABU2L2B1_9ACTN|nr:hypothetical protein [Streptomyces sp. DSM 44917]MDT0305688.1 hypothetical protein [Streptomyces sp. DSM 44917]